MTETPTGTVAALPMGDLNELPNTFWQLLYEPAHSTDWTLLTPPGVATNGGVVATFSGRGSITTGIDASLQLAFSALEATSNLGGDWATAVLTAPLAPVPSSVAADGARVLGLLERDGGEVVEAAGVAVARWTPLVDAATLRGLEGSSGCSVTSLTAIADVDGTPVVGARCGSAPTGSAPLFARISGTWRSVGPRLAAPDQVLRVVATPAGAVAIVESRHGTATSVAVLRSDPALSSWRTEGSASVRREPVVSTTVSDDGTTVVIFGDATGPCSGYRFGAGAAVALPAMPAGACVVVDGATGLQALRVEGSILVVYDATPGGWRVGQRLDVPIQYGSSS